ncbi:hypothetical protein [Streptomyces sp. NPDC001275]
MAMVGLFWIAGGDVYVGAKPSGLAPGVRLTPEGVVALGDGQSGLHLWEDVNALTVADVPVKSLMRQVGAVKNLALGTVKELALPMSHGLVDEAPAMMTVRVESSDGEHELATYVAAAVGYPQTSRFLRCCWRVSRPCQASPVDLAEFGVCFTGRRRASSYVDDFDRAV